MKTRVLMLFLAALVGISSCRSSSQSPAPPGPGPRTGTAPPVAPNPNPVAPSPPPPTPLPLSVPTPSPLAAAVPDQPVIATDTAPAPMPKSYAEILRLKETGRSDDFLLAKIRTENVNYHLTTSDIQTLRAAGVSPAVLEAMLRSGQPAGH